jgi:hypothetical protein
LISTNKDNLDTCSKDNVFGALFVSSVNGQRLCLLTVVAWDESLDGKIFTRNFRLFFHQMLSDWGFNPTWLVFVSWYDDIPNIWKNNKYLKPPTS